MRDYECQRKMAKRVEARYEKCNSEIKFELFNCIVDSVFNRFLMHKNSFYVII